MAGDVIRLKPARPCPICGKPASQQFHPFCSGRCTDIDLNRWLNGSYVIPAGPAPDDDSEAPLVPDDSDED